METGPIISITIDPKIGRRLLVCSDCHEAAPKAVMRKLTS